jgi:hypothetical protein
MLDFGYLPLIEYPSKHVRPCESTFIATKLEQDACHWLQYRNPKAFIAFSRFGQNSPCFHNYNFVGSIAQMLQKSKLQTSPHPSEKIGLIDGF